MRQADSQRLDRLVGDGNSEAGINLASLFRVILNQVQDSGGGVEFLDEFIEPVQAAVSNHARVEHWYSQFATTHGPWKALIADALDQLQSKDLLLWNGGAWVLGPAFATGKRLVAVPARKGRHGSVGVTLYAAADRQERGIAEQQRMEITSLAARLQRDGPGLRPIDSDHVAVLEQSMRDYGYRREFPPLADQHGRILDGRHRVAAARRAAVDVPPARIVKVASDEEAVGLAILVNIQRGWTQAERTRIDRTLQAAGLTMEGFGHALGTAAKRELVKTTLLENPEMSHKKIADRLGVAHSFVGNVCAEVVSESTSECRHGRTGQGARNDLTDDGGPKTAKVDDPELRRRIREPLRAGEKVDIRQLEAEFGYARSTIQRAYQGEHDLWKAEQAQGEATEDESASALSGETAAEAAKAARMMAHADAQAAKLPQSHRTPRGNNGTQSVLMKLTQRIGNMVNRWESAPPDPASEREELLAMRADIDERLKALGQ